ncbi:MAG: alpha/beta hydrolase family protein, partial [Rubrivivax sp.]
PVLDAAMLKAISPVENAEKILAPVLLSMGGADVRVPLAHGERMRDALARHKTPVEWVVYPEEGHSWRKPETHRNFWTRVERFLAQHLK